MTVTCWLPQPSEVEVCAALAGEESVQLVVKLQHHLVIQVPHVTPQGQLGHLPALNSLRHLHNMHTTPATRLNTFPLLLSMLSLCILLPTACCVLATQFTHYVCEHGMIHDIPCPADTHSACAAWP